MSDINPQQNDTALNSVMLMDQCPGINEEAHRAMAQSPLHHADLPGIAAAGPEEGGVHMQELALLGHLMIRGDAADAWFRKGIKAVLGIEVPEKLQCRTHNGVTMCWVSPDEWLVLLNELNCHAIECDLRDNLEGHFAIVNVSGGQTVLSLSGADAKNVLKKSTPYDVDERNFPVGKVVTSVFAKSQAIMLRRSDQDWLLVVRRSFADYIWLWLQEAAAEYGLVVKN